MMFLGLCLMVGGSDLGIPLAWAQEKPVSDTQGTIMEALLFLIGVLNSLTFICLKFLSFLAEPKTIFGIDDASGILLRMWQISRDIMNLIFAIMLLAGAVLTIVFGKRDVVKQNLVKFILAVILVNFSWFFPRVILDVANVTTATIYSLPGAIGAATAVSPPIANPPPAMPCVWRDASGAAKACIVMSDIRFPGDPACPTSSAMPPQLDLGILRVCLIPYDPAANTAFGIINGLVLNHGRLMYLDTIAAPPGGGMGSSIAEFLYFGLTLVVIAFLHIMLVFPIAALTAIMLVRIPILWLTVSFMPFMFIGFIIGDKFIRVNTLTIFTKHFLTAAFLPALIAIPFSLGFIMLNTFAALNPPAPPGLDTEFSVIAEVNTWWDMVWILVSFAVIWIGARWAMKSNEIYAKVSEPIMNIGSSFMKIPLKTPIMPHDTNKDGKYDPNERVSFSEAFGNLTRTGTVGGYKRNAAGGIEDPLERSRAEAAAALRGENPEATRKAAGQAGGRFNEPLSNIGTLKREEVNKHFNDLKQILRDNGRADSKTELMSLLREIARQQPHINFNFNDIQKKVDEHYQNS